MFGLIRIGEAAKLLEMTTATVRYWTNQGVIPYARSQGKQRLYDKDVLMQTKRQIRQQVFGSLPATPPPQPRQIDGEVQHVVVAMVSLGYARDYAIELGLHARELLPAGKPPELMAKVLELDKENKTKSK